jgi:hypothetical protein
MSCRGTVKNGVVVLEPGAELPEGAAVEVVAIGAGAKAVALTSEDLPAFGLWRDRSEFADSADASLELRRQIERRAK